MKINLGSVSYIRSTFVLAIDLIVSMTASAVVMLFANLVDLQGTSSSLFFATWPLGAFVASLFAFLITKSYQGIIRHSTIRELGTLCEAALAKEFLMLAISAMFLLPSISEKIFWVLPALDFLVTVSALIIVRIVMVIGYDFMVSALNHGIHSSSDKKIRILVYGVGEKAISISTRFLKSSHFEIIGYLVRKGDTHAKSLNGKNIYTFNSLEELLRLKERLGIRGIMFPIPAEAKKEENGLVEYARHINLKLYVAPSIDEIKEGGAALHHGIRNIKIEDLLGRDEIDISLAEVKESLAGKTVLVTGAAGSIGSELCRQLSTLGIGRLIMFDNAETPLHNLRLEFEDKYKWIDFVPVVGDVRLASRVDYVFRNFNPDIVFHAAAYKHVPLMEENPCEAVMVNVLGSKNVADKCVEYDIEKMVMVSTDKAVNPTNIMGCTKRLAEIYVQSLGLYLQSAPDMPKVRFVTTRFGNVLGSNGSVIPRFKEQIANGGPVTVTHPEIRRYFMTIPEACRLVLEASTIARGTHIYAFDMGSPVKIADLASRMIHLAGYEVDKDIRIVYSGLRPGEKLYEEVLADKENTIPTSHKRIFQAKVREYEYFEIRDIVDRLVDMARRVDIPDMVRLMKKTVPEFKSKHSAFETYDTK